MVEGGVRVKVTSTDVEDMAWDETFARVPCAAFTPRYRSVVGALESVTVTVGMGAASWIEAVAVSWLVDKLMLTAGVLAPPAADPPPPPPQERISAVPRAKPSVSKRRMA